MDLTLCKKKKKTSSDNFDTSYFDTFYTVWLLSLPPLPLPHHPSLAFDVRSTIWKLEGEMNRKVKALSDGFFPLSGERPDAFAILATRKFIRDTFSKSNDYGGGGNTRRRRGNGGSYAKRCRYYFIESRREEKYKIRKNCAIIKVTLLSIAIVRHVTAIIILIAGRKNSSLLTNDKECFSPRDISISTILSF